MQSKYIREVLNIHCVLDGRKQLGFGVSLVPLTPELIKLLDASTVALGGRWAGETTWAIEAEHRDPADSIDGDPSAGLRLLPTAMLIELSPHVKFGPQVFLRPTEEGFSPSVSVYDRLTSYRRQPRPIRAVLNEPRLERVKTRFTQLAEQWTNPFLQAVANRFVRACHEGIDDDRILDTSIPLEMLFLSRERDKAKILARRTASFIGSSEKATRRIDTQMRAFYQSRNYIIHRGVESPQIDVKDGRTLSARALSELGFRHLRSALQALLSTDPPILRKEDLIARCDAKAESPMLEVDGI